MSRITRTTLRLTANINPSPIASRSFSLAAAAARTPALAPRSASPLAAYRPVPLQALQLYRLKSTAAPNAWAKNPIVSYEELKPITEQPNDDILIIDVREPDEVALGSIPSAVSLPLSQLRDALDENYSPGEFQKKFAFPKPLSKQNIIFFCRSGKRSATASEWAGEKGYGNVRNYVGSWLDWSKREKEREGDD